MAPQVPLWTIYFSPDGNLVKLLNLVEAGTLRVVQLPGESKLVIWEVELALKLFVENNKTVKNSSKPQTEFSG